jgi:molybdopterin molybdotransferase
MLNVDDGLKLVLDRAELLRPVMKPVGDALGCVLAEDIVSDIDSPPHDKAIVDGYAVVAANITSPGIELTVLEEVTAGAMPTRKVELGKATRIMTGAPLPSGANAVVMVEQTETVGDRVRISKAPVKAGQNIMRRAASLARGQAVLQRGKLLRAIEIGLLTEVGRGTASVISRPTAAILVTGNELVEQATTPGPGQIRNSNGPMMAALARCAGASVVDLGIARDTETDLERAMAEGLKHDLLVISGGVSAGVLDLVPATVQKLGVQQVFHKVNLKPGKPLWFGVNSLESGRETLVFGLPGNPVSSLVCFELFVRPAIQKMRGLPPMGLARRAARLVIDHQQRGERPTYWPAAVCEGEVQPLAWKGSGDLRTLSDANCLAIFPAGERVYRAGEEVDCLLFNTEI